MGNSSINPLVLFVTPEVSYLPVGMGISSNGLKAKAGGLADVSAALISALYSVPEERFHLVQDRAKSTLFICQI